MLRNAEDEEERFEAILMMEKCKDQGIDNLLILLACILQESENG